MIQERAASMLGKMLTAFSMLWVLCQTPVITKTLDEERIGFTVPAAPWTLTLPKDDLVVEMQQVKPDGQRGHFSIYDRKSKMSISFFIEPATQCKDSKACRDMVWKSGNPSWENPQNVVLSKMGDVSYFEFLIPSFRGMPVKQHNVYAEFVKDEFWVDLHISKGLYKVEEHDLFERIIKSIKFEPKREQSGPRLQNAQSSQVMEHLREGSAYYLKGDFKNAINPYSKALELEKKQPTVEKTMWRVLIDNLGMSYGITGDFKKAKETFEYGLSKDDTYPLFYYNLACTHAELNDLDNTVRYLKRAFEYKSNLIAGEHMPDPKQDDSFHRFMQNERFLAALREIEQSSR